ncbi:MAG: class C sortase [Oscillospiraceae bacterium]|nr:class C sortase [Oscillospiraceae bacterium]
MKKHLSNIILILIFLVGLSMLLYPSVADYVNKQNTSHAIANYDAFISSASEEKIEWIFSEAEAYNKNLAASQISLNSDTKTADYRNVLNPIGTGIMGYVDIPKINVELPIYHGTEEGVLQIGVGHMENSSLPIGGESSHAVLSGHRGLPSAKLFTDLDAMAEGDIFMITVLNRVLTYRVDQIKTVLPSESEDMQIVHGKDYCTLVTCTPYGVNTHRLLVRGIRVEAEDEAAGFYVANEALQLSRILTVSIGAVPLLISLLILLIRKGIRKRNERTIDAKEESKHETE